MFYYLYLRFHTENHLFNLFRYITFRTAYASMTALVLSLVLGPWVIERLKKFQIGQYIREDGPQSHQSKAGTPTMGGIFLSGWCSGSRWPLRPSASGTTTRRSDAGRTLG